MEGSCAVTIFDVLGLHLCRDVILDYVPIRELVRSERVCRQWQQAVLDYLPRCSGVTILVNTPLRAKWASGHRTIKIKRCCALSHKMFCKPLHNKLGEKLGYLIDFFGSRKSDADKLIEDFALYCSSLRLRRLEFVCLDLKTSAEGNLISEEEFSNSFRNYDFEHLKFNGASGLSGSFLNSMESSNYKSLSLNGCPSLDFHKLLSAAGRLKNLKTLELNGNSFEMLLKLHLLLDKLPKLENLSLCGYNYSFKTGTPHLNEKFIASVSRLTYLKRLHLKSYDGEYSLLLKTIARDCMNLVYLDISHTDVKYKDLVQFVYRKPSRVTSIYMGDLCNVSHYALDNFASRIVTILEYHGSGTLDLDQKELEEAARKSKVKRWPFVIRVRQHGDESAKYNELKIIYKNFRCGDEFLFFKTISVYD